MPDTGAPWSIPYVAGTDLVSDWPTDSQTLAEAIADGLDAAIGLVEVKFVTKTDTFSASLAANAFSDVTGLSIAHAVADAAHRVIIIANLQVADAVGRYGAALRAGGTFIDSPGSPGSRFATMAFSGAVSDTSTAATQNMTIIAVDTPGSTSSVTYTAAVGNGNSTTQTVYVNRTTGDTNSAAFARGVSTMMLLEVAV